MFLKCSVSHEIMKSKTFAALFGLLTIVAIVGLTPAFAQYDTPDQSTGQIIGGKIGYKLKPQMVQLF